MIVKGAHYFVYTLVRITDNDVIRKDGGRRGDGRKRVDVSKGGACVWRRGGVVRSDEWWSGRWCCSLFVVGRFYRCLIRCRLFCLFGQIVYFVCS